jgi:hypothetical protein
MAGQASAVLTVARKKTKHPAVLPALNIECPRGRRTPPRKDSQACCGWRLRYGIPLSKRNYLPSP